MSLIPFYIESKNGHDTLNVPDKDLQNETEKQLKDGKWVTLEKKDGSTEILTEKDLPKQEPSKQPAEKKDSWKETFGDNKKTETNSTATSSTAKKTDFAKTFSKVQSATATNKGKGG